MLDESIARVRGKKVENGVALTMDCVYWYLLDIPTCTYRWRGTEGDSGTRTDSADWTAWRPLGIGRTSHLYLA